MISTDKNNLRMKKNRTVNYLFILVLVLIVINITTIVFFIFFDKSCNGIDRKGRGTPGNYLVHELEFTSEQQLKFDKFREDHHQQTVLLKNEIKNQKTIFYSELKNKNIDSLEVDSLSKLISDLHRKSDLITFWHFNKIRHICTPQQQERFDEIIKEGLAAPLQKRQPMSHLTE